MAEDTPRISVVIPTLQEEKLIARTLAQFDAALRKKFRIEVVVSDGGSRDKTLVLAREFADVLVTNCEGTKQNISIGRNEGSRAAHGEILVFINGDTIIDDLESFFSKMIIVMNDKGIVAATCKVKVHHDEENLFDRLFHASLNIYFWILNVIGLGMGRGECQVVRRDLFFALGGYNESIAAGEDFDLFVRLRKRGKIAFLWSLSVRESPRRYRKYGYLKISILWFINAIAVLFLGRSYVDHWEPVR